jgi:outer membrane protein TolC
MKLRSLNYTLSLFCFLLFINNSIAQENLSLESAVQEAIDNSFGAQIAKVNRSLAENSDHLSFAGGLPTVNFNINANSTFNRNQNPASFLTEINSLSGGVNPNLEIAYTLYNGGRIKYTKEQLSLQRLQSETDVQNALQQAVYNTTLAYFQAVIQQEQLEITKEVIALSKDRIKRDEARQEYGQAGSFDLLQTTDAYLNDSTTLLLQLQNFENAKKNLLLAMGATDLSRTIVLTDPLPQANETFELEDLSKKLFAQNPAYQKLLLAREIAATNSNIQRSNRLPQVAVRANTGYTYNSTFAGNGTLVDGSERDFGGISSTNLTGALTLNITMPIYDGGLRKKQVQNAVLGEIISQLNINQVQQQLTTQLAIAYENYNNQKLISEVATSRIENARRSMEIATERFNAGQINSFDYRAVQISYLNSNQTYLNALFNLQNAYLDILDLTGELIK